MNTIKDNCVKEEQKEVLVWYSLMFNFLLTILYIISCAFLKISSGIMFIGFIFSLFSFPWVLKFLSKTEYIKNKLANIVVNPKFDVGDRILYTNGFAFEESKSDIFKVIKVNEINKVLIQSEKDLTYKEIYYPIENKDYQKV